MAREFKDFSRSRKIKMPVQLLRVVPLYYGLDKSLREFTGHLPALGAGLARPHVAASGSVHAVGDAPTWRRTHLLQVLRRMRNRLHSSVMKYLLLRHPYQSG